ncbi:MAG: thiolase family protein [Chloroflexi bacterium]|nr:thiolase family protein [Chloroflexota bacterium]
MTKKDDVVIVSGIRTPFSKWGSVLREMHSSELGAIAIKECLKRVGMKGSDIDELYYGMCIQSEAALLYNVIARQALLKAGLPTDLVSLTVDRACCSSLVCVQLGYRSILVGEAQTCMAVGAENMSNTPVVVNGHRWGLGLTPLTMVDHLNPIMYVGFNSLAKDAGEGAAGYGIGREMLDMWALGSQQKYQAAEKAGKFKDELVPVEVPQKRGPPIIFSKDDFPKPDTTLEGLTKLKTIYGSPSVTAGNSPGLDAGASAIIIMKRSKAEEMGIKPLATILSVSSVAVIEVNEAFAAMPLVSTKVLADGNEAKWQELMKKTNPNGGAIAIGHPVGASGARILMTMMYELRRRGGGLGACGICGGLAQGDAAVIRVD